MKRSARRLALFASLLPICGAQSLPALEHGIPPGLPTITVDGVLCTLPDAIRAANAGPTVGGCTGTPGADLLVLDADVVLSAADTTHSALESGAHAGLPDVSSEIVIAAGRGSTIERDGALPCGPEEATSFRIFNVQDTGSLGLVDLTLRNGCVAPPAGTGGAGAAINVLEGTLELAGVVIENHQVHGTGSGDADGGAIFCLSGSVPSITDSTFRHNLVRGTGSQPLEVVARGGAISLQNCVLTSLQDSLFEANAAIGSSKTGGIATGAGGAMAVVLGELVSMIRAVTFLDNLAQGGTGHPGYGGALNLDFTDVGSISDCTFRGNRALGGDSALTAGGNGAGGAIRSRGQLREITRSVFEANTAEGGDTESEFRPGLGNGGAIHFVSGAAGAATINGSWFHANTARSGEKPGTGAATWARGGALAVGNSAEVSLIERVTFTANLAEGGAASTAHGEGGALRCSGSVGRIVNSTFVGNRVVGGVDNDPADPGSSGSGGALWLDDATTVDGNTFVGNEAQGGTGGGGSGEGRGGALWIHSPPSAVIAAGNLFTGNLTRLDDGTPSPEACRDDLGNLLSAGWNRVAAPGNCTFAAAGDVTGVSTATYTPADWGCATTLPDGSCIPTVAIDQDSAAVDSGNCTAASLAGDARETPRPFDLPAVPEPAGGDACDVGAFEAVDADGDGFTEAADCAPDDPGTAAADNCGVCGGDDSSCLLFEDGFESGDTSSWS